MKYMAILLLFMVSLSQAFAWMSLDYDGYGGYRWDDKIDVNDQREYWFAGEIWGNKFQYQYGMGWYFVSGKSTVDFKFSQPFSGKLKKIEQQIDRNNYSSEVKYWVKNVKEFSFENTEEISLNIGLDYNYQNYSLFLEDENKWEIIKLEPLIDIHTAGYIYSDAEKNILYDEYFLTRDLDHLIHLTGNKIIIDKEVPESEFTQIIELIITNNIIINEEKNINLLKYLYWDNYWEFKTQEIAYLDINTIDTRELKVSSFKDPLWNNETYVEIPYELYKFWKLKVTVLKDDRDFYIRKWVKQRELFLFPNGNYNRGLNHEYYNNPYNEELNWRNTYATDEIKSKYINAWPLTIILIIYLWGILAFYFLYHKRLKKRVTIIYFSLIYALIFFVIYLIWLKLILGTKNIIYSTTVIHNYKNFSLEESHHLYFSVKNQEFSHDITDTFQIKRETSDRNQRRNDYRYNDRGEIKIFEKNISSENFKLSPLRYQYLWHLKIINPPIIDNMLDVKSTDEWFLELNKNIKHFVKKYETNVKYKTEKIETQEEKIEKYTITIDY